MSMVFDTIAKGGPVMVPIVGMSVFTIGRAIERVWFWYRLLSKEDQVVHDVLEAAHFDLEQAAAIARQAGDLPIGRYLLAPLRLKNPTPETFHLALELAADREFMEMRRGDKWLESVVGIAPLLGLLGTVTGLIYTFGNLNIGGGASADMSKAAAGIGEALVTTAGGMVVAIIALSIFRILVSLQARQMDYFSLVGGELELIYRQVWSEPTFQWSSESDDHVANIVPLVRHE